MKALKTFETAQCIVVVFDTDLECERLKIYCIESFHKKTKKLNVRFGTKKQIEGIVRTYRQEKRFELCNND